METVQIIIQSLMSCQRQKCHVYINYGLDFDFIDDRSNFKSLLTSQPGTFAAPKHQQ